MFVHVSLYLCVCMRACACLHACFYLFFMLVCVCLCMRGSVNDCVCGRASVKRIVSKWQRGSRRENDGYVCGLITINSPFDCN